MGSSKTNWICFAFIGQFNCIASKIEKFKWHFAKMKLLSGIKIKNSELSHGISNCLAQHVKPSKFANHYRISSIACLNRIFGFISSTHKYSAFVNTISQLNHGDYHVRTLSDVFFFFIDECMTFSSNVLLHKEFLVFFL